MKKLIKNLLFFSLMLNCWVLHAANNYQTNYSTQRSGEKQINFSLKDFKIETVTIDGKSYTVIKGVSDTQTNQKGFAALPFLNTTLQLESNKNISIVSDGNYEEISLDYPLLPSRGTIYRNQEPSTIPFEIDQASITDNWYPGKVAENADPFVFRDVRGSNIYVYPFQYNAQKQSLRIYRNLKVTVSENSTTPINPLPKATSRIDQMMNGIYNSLFINYDNEKFANQVGEFGEILVLYTARDAVAIQPYIDWKREKGFKVTATSVATGTNVATIIKNAYTANPNILYVQLVGDWADIKSPTISSTTAADPTDPMMGCVVGTDLYPELMIGRFSCNSSTELTVQVNKVIAYEKNPDTNSSTNGWYKKALGIGSEQGAGNGDDGEADYVHIGVIKNSKLLPYTYTTVSEAYQTPPVTAASIPINEGLSLINYCGHGASNMFVTTGYSTTNVNASTNGSKLPFIFSVACVNGAFHGSSDCFAEAWLKKAGGGAVAVLMASINQPWVEPMRAQDYFNDIIKGGYTYTGSQIGTNTTTADQRTTFGSIAINGNVLMLAQAVNDPGSIMTIQTWTTFGDASLQIRTDVPKTLAVIPQQVVAGQAYSLTVSANGSPVKNALVSLYQNGSTFSALTNSSGTASVSHGITSGSAKLTVTAYNTTTYQGDVSVGGSSGNPTVTITAPANNANIVAGTLVNITATATDPAKSVVKVEFLIDGVSKSVDTSAPYAYSWNTTGVANGIHTIKTVVTDNENKIGENTISVNISSGTTPQDPVEILNEGFENAFPPTNWTADTAPLCWFQSTAFPHSGSKCAAVEWNHTMANGAVIMTPPLKISGTSSLEFWWIDKDYWSGKGKKSKDRTSGYDYTYCEVSTNGTTWTQVAKIGDAAAMEAFVKVTVNLTPYQGDAVRIRWRDTNSGNDNAVGTGLDDVIIKSCISDPGTLIAPTSLNANINGTNVSLSWSAPAKALNGYNIYRNGVRINGATITQTIYNDNNVAAGNYSYTVKAVYTNGESSASNAVNVVVGNTSATVSNNPPPVSWSTIRTPAEFEPVKTVVLQWDFAGSKKSDIRNLREYNNLHNFLVKNIQLAGAKVLIMVDDASVQSQITSFLQTNGTPLANVTFKVQTTNSIWSRDYSATSIYYGDTKQIGLVDWEYNRPRPQDDDSPLGVAAMLNQNLFRADENSGVNKFIGTGGNFMTDGFGLAISSRLIVTENGNNETTVKNIVKNYMGIDRYSLMNTLPYDGIHHIDMHMKLLDEETILVGQYPTGVSDGPAIEANLQSFLTNFKTVYGTNFRVVRIPMLGNPSSGGNYQTYTNSLIVNNYVLVPIYGVATDAQALQVYKDAMPGYTVLGYNCADIISLSGAIHCITHEVNQDKIIRIKHPRITAGVSGNLVLNAELWSNENVTSVKAYVKFNGQSTYTEYSMTGTNGNYSVSIPCSSVGEARYYIKAQSATAITCKPQAGTVGGYYTANVVQVSSIDGNLLPLSTTIHQNYPNPFNPLTEINYELRIADQVKLAVYNAQGELVKTLVNSIQNAGKYSVTFDGAGLNSGVYFYKLEADGKSLLNKMILVK